ncbi:MULTISPECIES: hypothetical protein [unclassified Bradyrhizobium]|uniref:hypothetical protein n=1 Tax=unclassified Bradyrhizobium TaxID=2631580 RepID=UPI001FFAA642|nr:MULTISPECIES: hypothetical protein [unclassified Bradyrhizobium]MCK1307788.1 hypothetical protein [Bradyrhizobium sp. 45]MCK1434996.1 hypothetical protein [Bradyrhizobium sp. 15]MCK1578008.1 hypothetical protein [Bradyrhizobium sp. 168]MCK1613502.1 hypothetical protein [Bradyrhizobium sp. 163]MCK1675337.1 hypothetical protein [Bradyrhizobium sp. 150]
MEEAQIPPLELPKFRREIARETYRDSAMAADPAKLIAATALLMRSQRSVRGKDFIHTVASASWRHCKSA